MASYAPVTPSRSGQQPFPYPATPQSRTVSTSSTATPPSNIPASTSSGSVKPTAPPISLAALLATHASAPNPHAAALDQALNERNQLSAQNTQLWKLIEKQRTAYNQVLKDLDRVRGERDALKGKLTGSGTKEKEKELKNSVSNSTMASVTSTLNGSGSELKPARHHSEDGTSPRHRPHAQDHLQSRSKTTPTPVLTLPAQPEAVSPGLNSNTSGSTSGTPTTALPPPTLSLSPDTPTANSTNDVTPISLSEPHTSLRDRTRAMSPPGFQPVKPPPRHSSIGPIGNYNAFANTNVNTNASSAPKSNSNFLAPANGSLSVAHTQPPTTLVHSPPQSPLSLQADEPAPQITGYSSMMQAALTPHLPAPNASANTSSSSLLSPVIESTRSVGMSRESRISLPDEAKRYIANMGESPVPSPHISGSAFHPAPPAPAVPPVVARSEMGESEFLDLDDTEEEQESPGEEDEEEEDYGEEEEEESQPTPMQTVHQNGNAKTAEPSPTKARPAVDDFPLPPNFGAGSEHVPPSASITQAQAHAQNHTRASVQTLTQQQQQQQQQQQSTGLHPQIHVGGSDGHGSSPYLSNAATSSNSLFNSASASSLSQAQSQSFSQSQSQSQNHLMTTTTSSPAFRALPLLASDLPSTRIVVSQSSIRPNDRGKDVLNFIVEVDPGSGKDMWKVEKLYSDVLGLDQRVRASVGKGVGKKIASLPEGKLWRDHAPAKVDQRKTALETYLQTLVNLPMKNKDEIIAFFCSDIVRETKKPVYQVGYREGYLTKRGKNFGGWKTRYFVLQGPVLEYYESRGGTHLGSITITGAQIGRQQRTGDRRESDDEKEYRHAFLIIEAKKGPAGSSARHVLCAESDSERDDWVEVLVRYVMGSYNDDSTPAFGPSLPLSVNTSTVVTQGNAAGQPRSSTSSTSPFGNNDTATPNIRRPVRRGMSKDDISRGPAVPISQLAHDGTNTKLFQTPPHEELRAPSPTKLMDPSPIDRNGHSFTDSDTARRMLERGQPTVDPPISSSLPTSSPLDGSGALGDVRANSELGHYPDLQERRDGRHAQVSPERQRPRDRKSFHPILNTVASAPATSTQDSAPAGDGTPARAKISGPLGGTVIPAGYKFGGKDAPSEANTSASDRREKAKSRSFWGFGKGGDKHAVAYVPRAVFGVTLEESLDIVQIANLPAVVFRCIQYLEDKKADQEEGIYRLSGSSAVIKNLKDMFNQEGDIDLLASDEYWDPHAIAGLLKSYLRELPASILTRELHLQFLSVIDFVDPQERIKELSHLIASLPIANYSLLRALTAHLILIVQNSGTNKMTMRNVGIVFSPTLGIPAGVFSLMLGEFNRVFNVDNSSEDAKSEDDSAADDPIRRNSRQYTDTAADQLLGLSGRTLTSPVDEGQSDVESISLDYDDSGVESMTEDSATVETFACSNAGMSDIPSTPKASKASHTAADRGLNIAVSSRGNRHSRIMGGGLPASPRRTQSPSANQTFHQPPVPVSHPASPMHPPK